MVPGTTQFGSRPKSNSEIRKVGAAVELITGEHTKARAARAARARSVRSVSPSSTLSRRMGKISLESPFANAATKMRAADSPFLPAPLRNKRFTSAWLPLRMADTIAAALGGSGLAPKSNKSFAAFSPHSSQPTSSGLRVSSPHE